MCIICYRDGDVIHYPYQQIPNCHSIERAYGSECTILYWLSLIALKLQSLTLSEWQIEMVFELVRSRTGRQTPFSRSPLHPYKTSGRCFVFMARIVGHPLAMDEPAWTMATLSPFLVHHREHLCCGGPGEQRFTQVQWFQFSLGNDSCSIMEQYTQVTKTHWDNEKWWRLCWVSASLVCLEKY